MEDLVIDGSVALSQKHGIPLVACNDVYYNKPDDAELKNILRCIQMGKKLEDDVRLKYQEHDQSFRSPELMVSLFQAWPEAIENTRRIAESCNLKLDTEQVRLPEYECPDGKSPEVYLEELVWQGVNAKYSEVTEAIKERVAFELSIINKMHYAR